MTFTDEDLTAYLDGEADTALVRAIDAALTDDADLAQRLDRLRLLGDGLPAAFDGLLARAPAYPLPATPAVPRWHVPAGLAAALVLGLGLGLVLRGPAQDAPTPFAGWMDYVAAYQALYVPQTLAGAALDEAAQTEQLDVLASTLGRDLPLPSVQGLTYRRGQVLGFADQALIQLAYLSDEGLPVALCIIGRPDAPDSAPQATRLEQMEAAHWVKDGFGFLLIGGQDANLIERAAGDFHVAL